MWCSQWSYGCGHSDDGSCGFGEHGVGDGNSYGRWCGGDGSSGDRYGVGGDDNYGGEYGVGVVIMV